MTTITYRAGTMAGDRRACVALLAAGAVTVAVAIWRLRKLMQSQKES